MLISIPFADDRVVGLRIDSTFTSEMLEQAIAQVEAALQKHSKIRLYVEMPRFDGITLQAFYDDMKYGLANRERFEREAVVTDQRWLEIIASVADTLFSSTQVRVFRTDQKEPARDWIQAG